MTPIDDETATILSLLTLEQKAALTSGAGFWNSEAVAEHGIRSVVFSDGPHGLRVQGEANDHLGIGGSAPATCFPPAVALGSAFDLDLVERVARAIGREAAAAGIDIVLGPGINIKRSPLCGRNFEYFSEDPLLSGELGTAWVRGLQSTGVGASLKHFAVNNQETDRMRVSADVDARALREIYLRGFERVVRQARPETVMCSYNRINGIYASEDPWLLGAVLREEWGFAGAVISDWGAVDDRVAGIRAGMDLEMPTSHGRTDSEIVEAVCSGELDEELLEACVGRVIELSRRERQSPAPPVDLAAHHALAREAAARSMVLLKNDDGILPLRRDARLAVIGGFAARPRYQGAGSSLINPTRLDDALEAMRLISTGAVAYASGGGHDGMEAAIAAARDAEIAVVFLGLPAEEESEGFDRTHIDLPEAQLDLLEAVVAVNPRTVVVLSNGGVVALPFADDVPAIVEGWLLGQAGGSATAEVLFGISEPSGRLTETIPRRLQDSPAFGNFPGELGHVRYGEGILVGYRGYDARGIDVAFPFGSGLSYTTFRYGHPCARIRADGDIVLSVELTNTGHRAGREVVQAYVSLAASAVVRAPRELKAFVSVELAAGATRVVDLVVRREDLAYWDARVDGWVVESGRYVFAIGASSRDIRGTIGVDIVGDRPALPLTLRSTLAEVLADETARLRLEEEMRRAGAAGMDLGDPALLRVIGSFPVGRIVDVPGIPLTIGRIADVLRG